MEILSVLGSIVAFLVIFSALVLVHEWGHFMAARIFGVKVEEFGLGFPPKAKKLFVRNGTEYTLNWLPLGGFVRLYGESDTSGELAKDPLSFSAKPVWQRIVIAGAGVFMNFVLAFILLVMLFMAGGRPLAVVPDEIYPFSQKSLLLVKESEATSMNLLKPNPNAQAPILIEAVQPESPAAKAGVQAGMRLTAIDMVAVQNSFEAVQRLHAFTPGTQAVLTLQDSGGTRTVTVTKSGEIIGLLLAPTMFLDGYHMDFGQALAAGGKELGVQTTMLLEALGRLGQQVAQKGTVPDEVGGPVRIAEAVHMANQIGFDALVVMAILLSVNLGVLNLLPIPALDGGRIAFLLIEGITRRRIKRSWEAKAHITGYLLLLILMVVVTGKDILHLFGV